MLIAAWLIHPTLRSELCQDAYWQVSRKQGCSFGRETSRAGPQLETRPTDAMVGAGLGGTGAAGPAPDLQHHDAFFLEKVGLGI